MKKILVLLSSLAVFLTVISYSTSVFASSPFKDLSKKHWAYKDIIYFVNENQIGGFPDGTFRAEKEISRGEFVAIISRFMSFSYPLEDTSKPFKDKPHWSDEAVLHAVNLGLILPSEYGDYFKPDTPITRLEMAKMASRAIQTYGEDYRLALTQTLNAKLPFADFTKLAKENIPFVAVVNGTGIINGYQDDTFKPSNKATRAEAVAILARLKRLGESRKPADEFNKLQEYIQISTLGNNIEAVTGIKVKNTKNLQFTYGTWSIKFKNIIAFDPALKKGAYYPMFKGYKRATDDYQLAAEVEITTSSSKFDPFSLTNIVVNRGSGFFSEDDAKKFNYDAFQQFTGRFPTGTSKGYLSGVVVKGEEIVALTGNRSKEGYYILNVGQ